MSKRRSESARVVDFFKNESLDVVDAVLGIVRDMAKARHEMEVDAHPNSMSVKRRKARKAKAG